MSSGGDGPRGSLERALQWTLGLLAVAVLLSLTGVGLWIGREGAEGFVASRLAHDAEAIIVGLDLQRGEIVQPLPPVYAQPFSGHYYWVILADGRVLRSRSLWDYALPVEALAPGQSALALREGPRGQRLLLHRAGYEKQGTAFTIAVAEDLTPLLEVLWRLLWAGVGLSLLGTLILVLVQRWLLRRGFQRVDAVRADVQRLGAGEIDRLREDVPAEIRPLVRELNQLVDAWGRHLQRSRNALGNLAHALKSPLNLILLHHPAATDDPVAAHALRMRELIDRELRRARLAGEGRPGRRFRPREDLADLIDGLRILYADKGLAITSEIRAPERLPFDQEDMLELIGNLLDNAAKWARERVHLTLHWGEELLIRVEDDGPGVDPAAAQALAARGSRLDEATPGHGLGLAIVREIAALHGGEVRLGRSDTLGGFAATLVLGVSA